MGTPVLRSFSLTDYVILRSFDLKKYAHLRSCAFEKYANLRTMPVIICARADKTFPWPWGVGGRGSGAVGYYINSGVGNDNISATCNSATATNNYRRTEPFRGIATAQKRASQWHFYIKNFTRLRSLSFCFLQPTTCPWPWGVGGRGSGAVGVLHKQWRWKRLYIRNL